MSFDLLSENLLLILSSILTAVFAYILVKYFKIGDANKFKPKNIEKYKRNSIIFIYALLGAFLSSLVLKLIFTNVYESHLPGSFIFMVLPLTLGVAVLVVTIITKTNLWRAASLCLALSTIFSLLLINSYYRFYPTFGELFNYNSNVQSIGHNQKGILLNFSQSDYSKHTQNSIEAEINNVNSNSKAGKIYSLDIPGKVSGFKPRSAYVYVPAVYSNLPYINLPVIVLSTGFPGLPENWIGSGIQTTLDNFANQHDGITPLVFMVDNTGNLTNDTECVNSPRGNVETYLTTDVPNYIKSHFRVINNPDNWAMGGLSMGGMCSVMLTLRHTNLFHYFLDFGGEAGPEVGNQQQTTTALFNGSQSEWQDHQPSYLMSKNNYKKLGLGGFYGYGDQDTRAVTQGINQLVGLSRSSGIQTVSEVVVGPHSFNVWAKLFQDSLPWVSNQIGATVCSVDCTVN